MTPVNVTDMGRRDECCGGDWDPLDASASAAEVTGEG